MNARLSFPIILASCQNFLERQGWYFVWLVTIGTIKLGELWNNLDIRPRRQHGQNHT